MSEGDALAPLAAEAVALKARPATCPLALKRPVDSRDVALQVSRFLRGQLVAGVRTHGLQCITQVCPTVRQRISQRPVLQEVWSVDDFGRPGSLIQPRQGMWVAREDIETLFVIDPPAG